MIKYLFRFRYYILFTALIALAAVFLIPAVSGESVTGVVRFSDGMPADETAGVNMTPGAVSSEYSPELDYAEVNGLIPLKTFHFTSTRYIKLSVGGKYKIEVTKDPRDSNEMLVWKTSDPDVCEVSNDGTVTALLPGDAKITVCDVAGDTIRSAKVSVAKMPDTILDVPYISQLYKYPNGCESVSTVMALNKAGIDITVDEFIDKYLDMCALPEMKGEELWGHSPWEYYLGDPRDASGLCCYAPVIVHSLGKFVDSGKYEVLDLRDVPLEVLCRDYLLNDTPVILWGTLYMGAPYKNGWGWYLIGSKTKEYFSWASDIHCVVLIGFDDEYYYFNDPIAGEKVAYLKSDVEAAYRGLYSQAVVIRKTAD